MTAILDTHFFIWIVTDPSRVTTNVRRYLIDPSCTVYLSVASIWEMVIKSGAGKLLLGRPVADTVAEQLALTPLRLLDAIPEHALGVAALPPIHRDPFDRLSIAQALVEGAVLLTADPVVRNNPVQSDW